MSAAELAFLVAGLGSSILLIIWDLRRLILPDFLIVSLGVAGLGFHWATNWVQVSWEEAAAGAVFGTAILFAFRTAYLQFRGIEALGLGDVKFMSAAGVWIGIWHVPMLLSIASLGTLLTVICLRLFRFLPALSLPQARIPFGPGLVIALLVISASQLLGT